MTSEPTGDGPVTDDLDAFRTRPDHELVSGAALRALIDRYFDGQLGGEQASLMFDSLFIDEPSARYFERRQVLADLDPAAPDAKGRIGKSLGFATPEPVRASFWSMAWLPSLSIVGAAAAVLFFVVPGETDPRPPPDEQGFSARGAGVDGGFVGDVIAYRILTEGPNPRSVELEGAIDADDELAFAYVNPKGRKHLMVWGVDEEGGVYWYHPAWTDADANPAAIAITASKTLKELPAAIAHDLAGKRLQLYALLTDAQPTVRDVEATLGQGKKPPGDLITLATLEVRRAP